MNPLDTTEQAIVDKIYSKFGILEGTPEQKSTVLQKFTGPREFHCQGEDKLSPKEFAEMELRANERVYLLLNPA